MAGRTRLETTTLALALVDSSSTDPFYSSVANTLADVANRQVYQLILEACPEYVQTVTSYTWAANTESIDVTAAAISAEPIRIISIIEKTGSGAVSPSNLPRSEWKPMSFHDRASWLQNSASVSGRGYVLQGDRLYVAPIPTQTTYIDIHWAPQLAALGGDSAEVLGGLAEPFGDAVGYCLASLLDAKQEGKNGMVQGLWQQARADIQKHARTRSSGPKFVRYVGPGAAFDGVRRVRV